MTLIGETAGKPAGELVKDATDASFPADVIEASREQPVIVDFWATWCGPCRQLGPAIEKAVLAAKGAVKLVKVDIDANPAYAGQLRVQSIPAVFAFVDGQPVDGFMGALPDSQIKAFVERIAAMGKGPAGPSMADEILEMARQALAENDLSGAMQAYAQILREDPEHPKALAGLARCYLMGGDPDRAQEVLEMAPADAKDPELDSVRAALALAAAAPDDTADLEKKLAANPDDHQARFDLAKALGGHGRLDAAVDHLMTIIERDRDWNDGAARKQILTIFEAAGPGSDVARQGRRRLSAILFS